MTDTEKTVVVVTKNADFTDFTEGRGPMLFHSVWADMATADAFIMRQDGIFGSKQGVSAYNRHGESDGTVNYNGYTAMPVSIRGLEGVLSPEREAEIKQELSDLDAALAELKAHREALTSKLQG